MKLALRLSLIRSNCIKHSFSTLFFILVFNIIFNSSAFAVSEREQKIVESGKLRVCIWPDYFSISYKNKKTGQLEGIDIDLSQELAQDLGVTVEYVTTHFGIFMHDLQQDNCDIAMFGVGITDNRAEHINYSEPYLSSSMYAIASDANPIVVSWESMDQPGVIVCVQEGTYMEQAMRDYLQHAELMTVVQSSQREIEVRSGRADVFIADYPYGQRTLQVYDWAKLLSPEQATEQFQYAYAIKKGEAQWLDRVNVFVQAIKADGRLEHYANKNNLRPIALIDP
ncbi:ABC transporter substrate-binding protein [Aliidiomarina quisquiliarum]|uniref:ABC transporter substrate-binding protein n=1 Tax=Aliidiomarina quisquiliarum TaxID=2938947 RepID=UPI00208F398B|nr:ABC transporter substrate-binding protein [Aliidiomarina quisquiliarum]MCO4320718.1 ABC transporter substrate-binding protein [Aliidiomarina quisquiliarum]